MKSKDYEDAIRCYARAIEILPTDAATYSNRALAYLK
jgi:tetratricopeptide (TPR) repeat protein